MQLMTRFSHYITAVILSSRWTLHSGHQEQPKVMYTYQIGPLNHTQSLWGCTPGCHQSVSQKRQVHNCNCSFSGPRWNFQPFNWVYCHKSPTKWPFCLVFLNSFHLCTLCGFPEVPPPVPAQHPFGSCSVCTTRPSSPLLPAELVSSDPAENLLRAQAHFSCLPFPSPSLPTGPLLFSCVDQRVLHLSWFWQCPSRWQTLLFPTFVQQRMKWNFNVSWSPLALLIKTTIITREVCKLATLATNSDTPNLAQIIAGSCLLGGYFNHWWVMPVRAIPGFDVP